ncbi:MAG: hypothetical protein CL875_06920 [Dehalococcoidales bacterium]|nr:hypothetical protein [Dehalococcoidales bacterium]
MKSKITKIMGAALALVLVFSLGAAFMPVNTPGGPSEAEAADLSWSGVAFPTGTGSVLVGQDENLGPVAVSPTVATDGTMFAVVNDLITTARPLVYKSVNNGHTWTATTSNLGAAGDVGIALEVSPNYAEDSTVFVVTQTSGGGATTGRVYRSVNGNISYGQLGVVTLAAAEVITSFDVSPNYDGTGVLAVGIADIAAGTVPAGATTSVQVWGLGAVLSWTLYSTVAYDVSDVIFSPNYAVDSTILAVTSLATAQPILRSIVGGTWGTIAATNVGATATTDIDLLGAAPATDLLAASIALPQDYNGTVATLRRAYVSIVDEAGAGTATASNVFRITNTTAGTAIATAASILLSNIDYRGTFAEGTIIGGLYAAAGSTKCDVYRTTNPADSVVNWYGVAGAANQPSGTTESTMSNNTTAFIKMSSDYTNDNLVVVGTIGDDSAFGVSYDGAVSFNETGLIDNAPNTGAGGEGALGTITSAILSPNFDTDSTLFIVTENDNAVVNNSNAWFSTDGGVLWTRAFTGAFATAGTGLVSLTPDFTTGATAGTAYVGETGGGALDIWVSSDGGASWSIRTAANITGIQTMAGAGTDLYLGDSASGTVTKSTNEGWTWPAAGASATGAGTRVASLKLHESTLLAGGGAGTVRLSTDGGATWSLVGGAGLTAGNIFVDFDAASSTYYAVETASGNCYRSVDNAAWIEIGAASTGANAIELILADDGSLYYLEIGGQDVYRTINPTAAVPTPDATWQVMALTPAANGVGLSVIGTGTTSNTVLALTATPAIRIYTDTLPAGSAGPNLVAPADGSVISTALSTRFTIEAMAGVTAYAVWWSTDSTLNSGVTAVAIAAPGVETAVQTLTEGATVYWMARATTPFNSPWSDIWTVESQVVTAAQAPVPTYPGGLAGSTTDVPIDMVFNWSSFKFANGYEFQLAMDADMTDFVADMSGANALGNITSYQPASLLEYSTTYYWRVRAILGTATAFSDWSAVVGFTTEAVPVAPEPTEIIVEPTPITITPAAPPPPAPAPAAPVDTATPAYIWAIIGIGAVLVIVVITLIVRTRRAA